ncbi:MAG: VOC family protein [Pseudomonadota bacterium]
MKLARSGIILFTFHYEACVAFYGERLGLPLLFTLDNEHSKLTCFDMGGSYLMIETGGSAEPEGKTLAQNPVWLRFNVEDVEATAGDLTARGVELRIRREVWGTLADFLDPDGNRCSLRDEASFHRQMD